MKMSSTESLSKDFNLVAPTKPTLSIPVFYLNKDSRIVNIHQNLCAVASYASFVSVIVVECNPLYVTRSKRPISTDMENELTMNAAEPQGKFTVKSSNSGRHMSHGDILNCRLKNRERQRRYRARKRLEADTRKASNEQQSTAEQTLSQQERNDNSCISCVPHRRKWKQDARRAQSCNSVDEKLETAGVAASSLKNQIERPLMALEMETIPIGDINSNIGNSSLPGYETHKSKLARRNWKAEARSMKA